MIQTPEVGRRVVETFDRYSEEKLKWIRDDEEVRSWRVPVLVRRPTVVPGFEENSEGAFRLRRERDKERIAAEEETLRPEIIPDEQERRVRHRGSFRIQE